MHSFISKVFKKSPIRESRDVELDPRLAAQLATHNPSRNPPPPYSPGARAGSPNQQTPKESDSKEKKCSKCKHFCYFTILLFMLAVLVVPIVQWIVDANRSKPESFLIPVSVEKLAQRDYFYFGGEYVNGSVPGSNATGTFKTGQIYVERLIPHNVSKKTHLVFISGAGQTGANWLNTPDGRPGWATFFLRKGYVVYLTDQPQRGRSPWAPGDGEMTALSSEMTEDFFTAPEKRHPLPYPQAENHYQWPEGGHQGSPTFDDFYASQVQFQSNTTLTAVLANKAYTALLQYINEIFYPVILITHSQAGQFGWKLANDHPELLKGLIQIEPGTTPFETYTGPPFTPGYAPDFGPIPFGLTTLPLIYEPDIGNNASLLERQHVSAPNQNLSSCILQKEPARNLTNIAKVPQLQIVSESSWHAVFDHCSAEYLKQAGCNVEFVPLETKGIYGNGHFMFLEENNFEIAEEVLLPWMKRVGA